MPDLNLGRNNMNNVLIIGINFHPEIISTAVYSSGLAEHLSESGRNVSVVTANPYYPEWKVHPGWKRWRYSSRIHAEKISVIHCPLYVPSKPSFIKRVLHHLSFAATSFVPILVNVMRNRPDVVLVVAPSLLSAPLALLCAKIRQCNTWLHIQDFEVEAALATGMMRKNSILAKLANKFESWVLRKFNIVSTISDAMQAKLLQKGINRRRVFQFRNWTDTENIYPLEKHNSLRKELGVHGKYVVLYSGNLAFKQGLEIIPQVIKELSHRRDIVFLICGDGPMRAELMQSCPMQDNVKFVPLQPYAKLNSLLACADVHLLPQRADFDSLVLPSKLTNMLASGIPTVATTLPGSAIAEELEKSGVCVEPGNHLGVANAICKILDDRKLRSTLGRNARQRALEHWGKQKIMQHLEDVLTSKLVD